MAVFPVQQTMTLRDAKNQTSTSRWWTNYDSTQSDDVIRADANVKVTAAAALSNGNLDSAHGKFEPAPHAVVSGASAQYDTVEDKVVFTFQTAAGSIHRYTIASPKVAIFQADGETVDFTNALVKQYVADWINTAFSGTNPDADNTKAVCGRDGSVLTVSNGGTRLRKKQERKFNTFTRNPALTGQGL